MSWWTPSWPSPCAGPSPVVSSRAIAVDTRLRRFEPAWRGRARRRRRSLVRSCPVRPACSRSPRTGLRRTATSVIAHRLAVTRGNRPGSRSDMPPPCPVHHPVDFAPGGIVSNQRNRPIPLWASRPGRPAGTCAGIPLPAAPTTGILISPGLAPRRRPGRAGPDRRTPSSSGEVTQRLLLHRLELALRHGGPPARGRAG